MLQKRKPQGYNQITPYIMAFTGIAYVVMGGFVIKRSSLLPITETMADVMGVLFIIYGLYRGWRAYKAFTDSSQD